MDVMPSKASSALYSKDTAGKMDVLDPTELEDAYANMGLKMHSHNEVE